MSSHSTHPSLFSRVRDPANRAAWSEFDRRYRGLILGYCRSLGLQLVDAEDVHQDVMMSLSSAMHGFQYDPSRGRFRSYLGQAVRRAVARQIRRHGACARPLDADVLNQIATVPDTTDARWDDQWVRHHLRQSLDRLRATSHPHHLDVFERLLTGSSVTEVADMFDLTPEAVRKIKQRVRDRLRESVARQIQAEGPPHG